MDWQEFDTKIREARRTLNDADSMALRFARLLVGRLRHVGDNSTLAALKKELSNYNSRTGEWHP